MKVAAIVIAAMAVATGALAQSGNAPRQGETIGQKADKLFDRAENATKRGVDRMRGAGRHAKNEAKEEGRDARQASRDAGRQAGQEGRQARQQASRDDRRDDSRAMGAGRSNTASGGDSQDRRGRMDDAYANWKKQQKG